MGSYGVVLHPPPFNQHLGLQQRVEDLAIEQLITQLAVERLDVAVLPGAARLRLPRPRTMSVKNSTDRETRHQTTLRGTPVF